MAFRSWPEVLEAGLRLFIAGLKLLAGLRLFVNSVIDISLHEITLSKNYALNNLS